MSKLDEFVAVRFDKEAGELVLLDQTLLPNEVAFIRLRDVDAVWEAIRVLRVRGAPAIGVAAGYGVYLGVARSDAADYETLAAEFMRAKEYLATSRPTAVNLFWVLDRMERCLRGMGGASVAGVKAGLLAEAEAICREDVAMCRAIGEHGLGLLKPGMGLLTHCNAGQLAASRYGTALAPVYVGEESGYGFRVYADETRPLLQGARLTSFELFTAGVDVTLICDNMAAMVMKRGLVDAVLVGCDRFAANGDAANKIGTLGVAVLAKRYGIPFYVLGPTSTIDMGCVSGEGIVIEERDPGEVTDMWYERPMAPGGVKVFNPAFDVTDNELITAIVTERGVVRPPFGDGFKKLFAEKK